jgi:hypothetical protein
MDMHVCSYIDTMPCSPYTYQTGQLCEGPSLQLEVATVLILVSSIRMALDTVPIWYSVLHDLALR